MIYMFEDDDNIRNFVLYAMIGAGVAAIFGALTPEKRLF